MSTSAPIRPHGGPRPPRRVDASMDLLNEIIRNPLDPDYAAVAARGDGQNLAGWRLGVALVGVGLLFTLAILQTTRERPALGDEHSLLVTQVQGAERRNDALRAEITDNRDRVAQLRTEAAAPDRERQLATDLTVAGAVAGTAPVQGPGVTVVVDDAPGDNAGNRVLDRDLQQLVNGLWAAGAEAISVNDHRLSSLTAIRGAGDSITVDYRSLVRPYRVEAVGAPGALRTRFEAGQGGRWWGLLRERYGLAYSVTESAQLRLPGDPGITLRHARSSA